MKKVKKGRYKRPTTARKKQKKKVFIEKRVLFALFCIVGVIFLIKNFAVLFSWFNPVAIEKAMALEGLPTPQSLLSPTPTPVELPLFSLNTFATPTASPTPTEKPLVQAPLRNDYCINVPILIYHHVQPIDQAKALGHAQLTVDSGIFDTQMQYLTQNGYTTISSNDVVAAIRNHAALPAKSIVVTLDDGYDDAYNYAFQIAKKYNVKMDFMIPSGLINNPGYMNWDQLKEMSQNSLITIYNHTWSHAALGSASEETIQHEVMTANDQLESSLGKKINVFVYPYGSFGPLVIQFLQQHGYVGGISTINGTMQCESYIMTLHRTHIGNAPLSSYGF